MTKACGRATIPTPWLDSVAWCREKLSHTELAPCWWMERYGRLEVPPIPANPSVRVLRQDGFWLTVIEVNKPPKK